ncbi:hypothetical protein GJ496_000414 [Pomphorhynchus laevis]|nr:hypothetical protein GJ496_000414 [Pomphorhynchus laevis]
MLDQSIVENHNNPGLDSIPNSAIEMFSTNQWISLDPEFSNLNVYDQSIVENHNNPGLDSIPNSAIEMCSTNQ